MASEVDFQAWSGFFDKAEPNLVSDTVPFCQLLRPTIDNPSLVGLAITEDNAKAIGFVPNDDWKLEETELGGKPFKVWHSPNPRLLVLHFSPRYVVDGVGKTSLYSYETYDRQTQSAFSYAVVQFVDNKGDFMSKTPCRLKLSGVKAISFKNAVIGSHPSFFSELSAAYKELTGKSLPRSNVSLAHAIFEPTFKGKAVDTPTNNKVTACVCASYKSPTPENLRSILISPIENGKPTEKSLEIMKRIEETESWVNLLKDHNPSVPFTLPPLEDDGLHTENQPPF